jgi:hypothetical protein
VGEGYEILYRGKKSMEVWREREKGEYTLNCGVKLRYRGLKA